MKDFLNKFVRIGIRREDDFYMRTLKIAINVLLYNSVFFQLIAVAVGVFIENNYDVVYILLGIPIYSLVIYFNYKSLTHIALTIMFTLGSITLALFALRSGESSMIHSYFALTVVGLSVLYRKGKMRAYYFGNLIFTGLIFLFVLLSFQLNWFADFVDSHNRDILDRRISVITIFITATVFSLVVVVSFGRQYRRLYRANEKNEILLSELNHRVKNNLAIITSLIRLKRESLDEKNDLGFLDLESRVKAMAMMHDNLYMSSGEHQVEIAKHIHQLIEGICTAYKPNEAIECRKQIDSISLGITKALPFSMIVNELIINSLKHAFTGISDPRIEMILKVEDGEVFFEYRDNGVGFVDGENTHVGLGRDLIKSLCEQIDGTCIEDYSESYRFTMQFKTN